MAPDELLLRETPGTSLTDSELREKLTEHQITTLPIESTGKFFDNSGSFLPESEDLRDRAFITNQLKQHTELQKQRLGSKAAISGPDNAGFPFSLIKGFDDKSDVISDWLLQFCILSSEKRSKYEEIFTFQDENQDGLITKEQVGMCTHT